MPRRNTTTNSIEEYQRKILLNLSVPERIIKPEQEGEILQLIKKYGPPERMPSPTYTKEGYRRPDLIYYREVRLNKRKKKQ